MLKKMMLMSALICSMILSVNAQEITENLKKALNDPQDSSKQEKKAEIKEINKEDAELRQQDKALLKNDTASQINSEVKKDIAEDDAIADTEDAITDTENVVESDTNNDSSWFGWLWPFGGDDKTVETDNTVTDEEIATEEVSTATTPDDAAETIQEDTKTTPAEPKVAEDNESWFGWLWPFGGDDKTAETDNQGEQVETKDAKIVTETVSEPAAIEQVTSEEMSTSEEPEVASTMEEDEGGINLTNKLIYYFPNLFLNLFDSFTGSIGVGPKSSFELSMTRYAQFGGSYGDSYFLKKGIHRRYGGGYDHGYSLEIGPLMSEERYIDKGIGDVSFRILKQPKLKQQHPTDLIYTTKYRDFWTVGIDVGWFLNIGLHLEPVEFADFITGIFFYDLCDDDLGRTVDNQQDNESVDTDTTMEQKAEELEDMQDSSSDTPEDESGEMIENF